MTAFETKQINSKTLSEKLKQARQALGLSISQASKASNIQIKYLKFLEKEKFSSLPEDIYVKGFLKEYSKVLGVDYKILIKLFNKEKQVQITLNKQVCFLTAFENKKSKSSAYRQKKHKKQSSKFFKITPKILSIFAVILAIFGFLFYLGWQIYQFASPPDLEIFEPPSDLTIFQNNITIKGRITRDAKLMLNNIEILTNDKQEFEKQINLQPGINILEFKAENRLGKTKKIIRKIIVQ